MCEYDERFIVPTFHYMSRNEFSMPVLKSRLFFSVTPFPSHSEDIPVLSVAQQDVNITQVLKTCDLYHPSDINEYRQKPEIPNKNLQMRTITIFLEISNTTIKYKLVEKIIRLIKTFVIRKLPYYISIITFGKVINYSIMRTDMEGFTVGTICDTSEPFDFNIETMFFSTISKTDLLLKYLDFIASLNPSDTVVSLDTVFRFFSNSVSALKNPAFILAAESGDIQAMDIDAFQQEFIKKRISFDFYLLGEKSRPNILKLVSSVSCFVKCYGFSQVSTLINDVNKTISRSWARFVRCYVYGPEFVKIPKSFAVSRFENNFLNFEKVIEEETFHFWMDIDHEKINTESTTLRFVFTYFDRNAHMFFRVIPFKFNYIYDQLEVKRNINPESIVAAAASKLARRVLDGKYNSDVLTKIQIDLRSDYFSGMWDPATLHRVRVVANTIGYLTTQENAMKILGKRPYEIFNLLAPICIPAGMPDQPFILAQYEGSFAVELSKDLILCVEREGTESSFCTMHELRGNVYTELAYTNHDTTNLNLKALNTICTFAGFKLY